MDNIEIRDLREIFKPQIHSSNYLKKFNVQKKGYDNYPIKQAKIEKERILKHSLQLDVFVKVLSSIFIDEIDIANFSLTCTWFHYIANCEKLWKNKTLQKYTPEINGLYNVENWKLFYIEAHLLSKYFYSNWFVAKSENTMEESKENLYFSFVEKNKKNFISSKTLFFSLNTKQTIF